MPVADEASELASFGHELQQELLMLAAEEDGEELLSNVYTRYMIEQVIAAGELTDGRQVYFRTRGAELSGYALDDNETTLDLFVTVFVGSGRPDTVRRDVIEGGLRRLRGFFDRARDGLHETLEDVDPARHAALLIHTVASNIDTLRLFVFTDGLGTVEYLPPEDEDGLRVSYSVWDLRRHYRFASSGREQEPIAIDFVRQFGGPVPCLDAGTEDEGSYRALLAIFPGPMLEEIYSHYGSRLLELNVRSFLSARGKVNRGIRDTVLDEPGRFLAYNNGISATASAVELTVGRDGGTAIASIRDLQIVNGAQTTASLHHAARREKADLSRVSVQAKITVVRPEKLNELVPLVSRYSNSQNKVSEADFSASDPFHLRVETLSRSTWAPATDGTRRGSKWFYERARGQYQDALGRAGTPSKQKQFKLQHPPHQKITKTDLAKFENIWHELPHIVSRGAQKNFVEFTLRPKDRKRGDEAANYFELLVARAIIFKKAEKLIGALKFGGYRANIVYYTLAVILHHRRNEVDLPAIWRSQDIPSGLAGAIEAVAPQVFEILVNAPGGGNVTEWAKKEACWDRMRDGVPAGSVPRVSATGRGPSAAEVAAHQADRREQSKLIKVMGAIPAEAWNELQQWSRQSGNMTIREREVAMRMEISAQRERAPSLDYAERARDVWQQARELGFRVSAPS